MIPALVVFRPPDAKDRTVGWEPKYVHALLLLTVQFEEMLRESREAPESWRTAAAVAASVFARGDVARFLVERPVPAPASREEALEWLTLLARVALRVPNLVLDVATAERDSRQQPKWGPPVWFLIHHVAYWSPDPTAAPRLVHALPHLLPCQKCRYGLASLLEDLPRPDADTPYRWTGKLHNRVTVLHLDLDARSINGSEDFVAYALANPMSSF